MQTEFHLRQEDVARYVGKDRSSIANALRLLKLPQVLQDDLEAGRLSMGHARALLALELEEDQLRLRDYILAAGLSVRETEAQVVPHASLVQYLVSMQTRLDVQRPRNLLRPEPDAPRSTTVDSKVTHFQYPD